MIASLVAPRATLAVLERAACPERFQDRWATVGPTTVWSGRFYQGHAPALPSDPARARQQRELHEVIERWRDDQAPERLRTLLAQGGLVHTVHSSTSPWARLLRAIPAPSSPDRPHWARLAILMMAHGASLDEVAYPWIDGEAPTSPPPVEEPPVTVHPAPLPPGSGAWQALTSPQGRAPGLMIMAGITGSGKSTLMSSLVRQARHHPCESPLAQAATAGNAHLVQWLLDQGADPLRANPCRPGLQGQFDDGTVIQPRLQLALPFMLAEWNGHHDLADHLEACALALAESRHLRQNWPPASPGELPGTTIVRRRL